MDLTTFFGQAYGIYLFVMGIVMLAYYHEISEAIEEFAASKMLFYIHGNLTFIIGLLVVLSHFKFNSILAGTVTVFGILTLIEGLIFMFFPHSWIGAVAEFTNKRWVYIILGILSLLLGGFLITLAFVMPLLK